jgi:hypothetical protein
VLCVGIEGFYKRVLLKVCTNNSNQIITLIIRHIYVLVLLALLYKEGTRIGIQSNYIDRIQDRITLL